MFTNDGIMSLLEDEFGKGSCQLFCEMYSRFCEFKSKDNTDEYSYDKLWFDMKGKAIKEGILIPKYLDISIFKQLNKILKDKG
jgi:hypothetical protein